MAIQQNPSVTYEEIHEKYLAEHDGRIITKQVSPNIFEAIALKTSLILFEGNYAGIVKPYIHYFSLKKDFSNVDEVLDCLNNNEYVEELTERAYSDIIKSGQYSYRKLVNNLDDFIAQRVSRGYDVPLVSGLLGSQPSLASNLHIQEWRKTHSVRSIPTNTPLRADHIRDSSPPRAQAGTAQTVSLGATVMLDGSSSQSMDGSALSFAWSFLSLPAGSQATLSDPTALTPTFVVDQAGAYVAQLIVRAGTLESLPALVVITSCVTLPLAQAGTAQTVSLGAIVILDGSSSQSVDGAPLSCAWSFLSLPAGSQATLSDPTALTPTFVADQAGAYVAQLIVRAGTLESLPALVVITSCVTLPLAQAGTAQTVSLGAIVILDGSSSQSVDGAPLSCAWSFLSLPAGSQATLSDPTALTPTFVADQAGAYVAQLIVRAGTLESLPALVVITTQMVLGREHLYTLRTRVLVRETLVRIKPAVATKLAHRPLLFRITRRLYWLVRAPLYPLARVLWKQSRWFLHKL